MPSAVSARRQEWVRAVCEADLDGYTSIVTEDVVWLPSTGDPVVGRGAFRRWLEPFLSRYEYTFTVDPLDVRMFDGWCAELGLFRSRLVPRDVGDPLEHAGRYFLLWRLDEQGEWCIERYVDGIGTGTE